MSLFNEDKIEEWKAKLTKAMDVFKALKFPKTYMEEFIEGIEKRINELERVSIAREKLDSKIHHVHEYITEAEKTFGMFALDETDCANCQGRVITLKEEINKMKSDINNLKLSIGALNSNLGGNVLKTGSNIQILVDVLRKIINSGANFEAITTGKALGPMEHLKILEELQKIR